MLYPISNNKNRIKMRPDTVLESFPLYCPKCKQGAIINAYALHIRDELVADAFASLPEQEQGILILHCVLELADGEIGGLVGMSRSAVQRHRTKALNELRKRLEDERRKPK